LVSIDTEIFDIIHFINGKEKAIMSNQQQTRILAATQIQQDKKRDLSLLSRASAESRFNNGQERQITAKSHQQQLLQKQSLLTRSTQNQQKSGHNPERLIAAHSLQILKHRQQTIMSRAIPQNNDELDITPYWWLTPSIHRLALKPSYKQPYLINPLL
jgi:hypothetical protein